MSFIELCLAGQESPEKIDDYVELWHRATADWPLVSLEDFLGMTGAEYAYWARTADIEAILANRRAQARFAAREG